MSVLIMIRCFNPRTHTGCDSKHARGSNGCKVSIHAPTRGATRAISDLQRNITCFNPRTHTGCDVADSTHNYDVVSFNPRTHTGCDKYKSNTFICTLWFQSTHPHGVRHKCGDSSKARGTRFNPRTHTGCDGLLQAILSTGVKFQSTHPHGVRLRKQFDGGLYLPFQSTHPHGVLHTPYNLSNSQIFLNPPPHRGGDGHTAGHAHGELVSIHAPTRGATVKELGAHKVLLVSIHAPTRGAT